MDIPERSISLYSVKSIRTAVLLSAGYLLLSKVLIGFKPDQLFLIALFNILYFVSAITRKFILGFSIFIVFLDSFRLHESFPELPVPVRAYQKPV